MQVTLATFDDPIMAQLAQSALRSEGVEAYIRDINTIAIDPLFSNAIGGIKLMVDEKDLERAATILRNLESQSGIENSDDVIVCPKCNSTDIQIGYKTTEGLGGFLSFLLSLLLLIFPFGFKVVNRCRTCNATFKSDYT